MEALEIVRETLEIKNEVKKGNKNKSFKFKYLTTKDKQEIFILGQYFVENNKNKCSLIIDDNINCELRDKYTFDKKGEHSATLIVNEESVNFSCLFNFYFLEKINLLQAGELAIKTGIELTFHNNTLVEFLQKENNLIDTSSLINLDTSEFTDLSCMFCCCSKIKDFNFVKNWNVSKCKNFTGMFKCCNFTNLDFLSKWDLSNATSLSLMFEFCSYLNDIKGIKNWNVKNVEYFHAMFDYCKSLTDANDLQNWDMSKAKDIGTMFHLCINLKTVDSLYKWKLNDEVNKTDVIKGCNKLLNIPSIFKNTTSSSSCIIY